jgi:hypothetical protein
MTDREDEIRPEDEIEEIEELDEADLVEVEPEEDEGDVEDAADDAAPEEEPAPPRFDAPAPSDEPEMVPCAYCAEPHPAGAWRCKACGGFLPIIEETIHKEHFFFLFCSLSLFIGTLLDWEWGLPGAAGILGGFLLITSGYAMFASVVNIWYRRMIVWPHLSAMAIGLWAGWQRVIQLLKNSKLEIAEDAGFTEFKQYVDDLLHLFAPGLWIVCIVSTVMLIFLIVSIFSAGKRDAQRKAAMRAERAAARPERKRR